MSQFGLLFTLDFRFRCDSSPSFAPAKLGRQV